MDFTRMQELDIPLENAVSRLKQVLKQQGFEKTAELEISDSARADLHNGAGRLVTAYNSELAPRALQVAPEAALLVTATFLVRQSGEGSLLSVMDPEVLSIMPEKEELQSVVQEARTRVEKVIQQMQAPQQEVSSPQGGLADQVEQRLYQLILKATEILSTGDLAEKGEQIFVLAKAYTAISSLKRTEEIELHLG